MAKMHKEKEHHKEKDSKKEKHHKHEMKGMKGCCKSSMRGK